MARQKGWTGELAKFGAYLRAHKLDREAVAKALGVTPSYVSMLAHGKPKRPGFDLALKIETWTRENVRTIENAPAPFSCTDWA
jgi:transcriptional regulator with XRE-family HTH domain